MLALSACGGGGSKSSSTAQATSSSSQTTAAEPTATTRAPARAEAAGFSPESVYKARSAGVVTIIAESGQSAAAGPQGASLGSGFVIDATGNIATNAHVVTNDTGTPLGAVFVEFWDGNRVAARIVGTDLNSDVALVKINPGDLRGPGAKLDVVPLGSTESLLVGDPVAAIGSPFGEQQSLSVGVVSALHRHIESLTRFPIGNAVQTDAAINHGNSGGPLLDAKGFVIGINSQIRSTSGGGEGVGFAIPVETAKRSLDQLRAKGSVEYAYLGVSAIPVWPQLAERLHAPVLSGALVDQVQPGSPAQKAGVRGARSHITFQGQPGVPAGADIIVAVNGTKLNQVIDLSDVISRFKPGDKVKLDVVRNGTTQTIEVTLGSRPSGQR
jgi:S1-C subfamily serine protease